MTRILLIEDSFGDARLIWEMIRAPGETPVVVSRGDTPELDHEETLASGLARLETGGYDLLLLDLALPDSAGLETLGKALRSAPAVPVVVLTGVHDEELARKALEDGAQDYLVKGRIDAETLSRAIRYSISRHVSDRRLLFLSTTASGLVSAGPEEVDGQIEKALEGLAALVRADRCFLHLGDRETGLVERVYEWFSDGLESRAGALTGFDLQPMKWLVYSLEEDRTITFEAPDELPPEASFERSAWTEAGIRSFLGVPLMPGGRLIGILGFSSETGRRTWEAADEHLLRQASGVLSQTIARARAQAALMSSEDALAKHTEELRNLLIVASHELRHPSTVFKVYSRMLLDDPERLDSDDAREALRSIDEASDRVMGIVNGLLDVSRLEQGKLVLEVGEVEPGELLREIASEYTAPGVSVNVTVEVPDGTVLYADGRRLRAVVGNLLENALKFSPEGEDVDMTISGINEGFLFSVRDRGAGIPKEQRREVFERFHQVEDTLHHSKPGLGIGLYVAREIVEASGGWIACRDREGGGSIFEFLIPGSRPWREEE